MNIDKSKLKVGIWYEDDDGNVISTRPDENVPNAICHVMFPLEIQEHVYKTRDDGGYGAKNKLCTFGTCLSRDSGRLAVAMVNSGEYDLYEALAVLAQTCERCLNVLWNKYLPDEDGYAEYSEEWYKAGTVCDFCKES